MFLLIHHSSLTSIHVIAEISFLSNRIQERPRVSEVLKFRLVLTQLNCVLFLWSSCENRIAGKKTIALAHHCAQKGLGFETCNWAKLKTPVSIHATRKQNQDWFEILLSHRFDDRLRELLVRDAVRRATGVLAGVVRQVEVNAHQNVFLKHNEKKR